jgi:hypothetical protein
MKSFLLMLVCFLGVSASALASIDDVAIDPGSGDTFIVERYLNPKGEVLILNDHDESFRQTLNLLDSPAPSAHFEIEMDRKDNVTYVMQVDGYWYLNGIRKGQNGWKKLSAFSGMSGRGEVRNLTALPDGKLALTVVSQPGRAAEVLLIEAAASSSGQGSYQVIESIPEAAVEARATEMVASIADTTVDYASGSGFGFAAGLQSGLGMAYRRHFANKWGVQVAGIAWGDSNNIFANLGGSVMWTLSKSQSVRFYALAGASVYYSGQYGWDYVSCPEPTKPDGLENGASCGSETQSWQSGTSLNFGLGVGMEIMVAKRLGLALELPLTLMLRTGSSSSCDNGSFCFGGVYPIPNGSLIYYF